ncbi:MAG TPA: ATP-binding protein [bacterium]|nr:ATP-binding protein [bacterium]
MTTLRRMAESGEEPEEALRQIAAESGNRASVAGRVSRLTESPLDRLVLAGLYLEGQDLGLRRRLRSGYGYIELKNVSEHSPGHPIQALSAENLVTWLGGPSEAWRVQIAQRLLPQGSLTSRRLISRTGAATPLEGAVRLTPFLASLLYPGDASETRQLDENLSLDQPSKRLGDLVLNPQTRRELESFLKLCKDPTALSRCALLWGRAGTGKTLSAGAIAGELGLPLLSARASHEENESLFFERAAAAARIEGAVLFLDECGRWMDKEAMRRGPSAASAALLQVLQNHPGVVMGAMNQGWLNLHEAFQRRFQNQILFKIPNTAERAELWKRHLRTPSAQGTVEGVARRYELTGGLIRNAAARADSLGLLTLDAVTLDAEAKAQISVDLDWPEMPDRNNIAIVRHKIARSSRWELVKLGLRLKVLIDLPETSHNWKFQQKIALECKDLDTGYNAAVMVAKVAGLQMRWESLLGLTRAKDEDDRYKRHEFLSGALSQAWAAGILPVLGCTIDELDTSSRSNRPLMDFLNFRGTGILVIGGEGWPPLPKVTGTILLETKEFDFVAWGRENYTALEPWAMEDGVGEQLLQACSADSGRAALVLREAIVAACLRRNSGRPTAQVTRQDAAMAADFHLRGLKPRVKLLF